MATNSKIVSKGRQGNKDTGIHNTLVYIRQHWQLYLIFLMPALLLTLIFKYAPMSGILIAFQDYNPFNGVSAANGWDLNILQDFCHRPILWAIWQIR